MITFLESGIRGETGFGDIDEPFYNSMESMFEPALKFIVKEDFFINLKIA